MISSLDPKAQRFLLDVNRVNTRMERAQRQISTGVRVRTAADDPAHTPAILEIQAALASATQWRANLGRMKAETDTAEHALQAAASLLDRVRTLGAQAASGTQTDDTRQAIASEVRALLEQLVGVTRANVEGRFIFSGDADQTAPYSIDWSQDPPVSAYAGSANTRLVEHPNGTTFAVSRTAQDIFDSADPAANVFLAVDNLRRALESNDESGVQQALIALPEAAEHLNFQLAYYGTVQNRIAEAMDAGERLKLDLQTQLTGLQEADLTEAILELNQSQIQQDAALGSWSRLPKTSLFDYLG